MQRAENPPSQARATKQEGQGLAERLEQPGDGSKGVHGEMGTAFKAIVDEVYLATVQRALRAAERPAASSWAVRRSSSEG